MALSSRPEVPAFDASDLKELKRTLVTACRVLDREGITDGYGHVSARVPGADAFLTIANVSPGLATVERLIMMDLDGKYLGGAETPPNEWPIHACVFKVRPDVMSIAHTNNGMRLSDMPGARCFSIVTAISTAPMSAAISVKVIIWAQTSIRLPGE